MRQIDIHDAPFTETKPVEPEPTTSKPRPVETIILFVLTAAVVGAVLLLLYVPLPH
jgi:hypothetical protein